MTNEKNKIKESVGGVIHTYEKDADGSDKLVNRKQIGFNKD